MYQDFNPEILKYCLGKTILYIKRLRPDLKLKQMYSDNLPTMAIRIYFTDRTSIQIDTWQGRYNTIHQDNSRVLSYMTFLAIKKNNSLFYADLVKHNRKVRRKKSYGVEIDNAGEKG